MLVFFNRNGGLYIKNNWNNFFMALYIYHLQTIYDILTCKLNGNDDDDSPPSTSAPSVIGLIGDRLERAVI